MASGYLLLIQTKRIEETALKIERRNIQNNQMKLHTKMHNPFIGRMINILNYGLEFSDEDMEKLKINPTKKNEAGIDEHKTQMELQSEVEMKIDELMKELHMQGAVNQCELDGIEIRIQACEEQIQDAKKDMQNAVKEMYSSGR